MQARMSRRFHPARRCLLLAAVAAVAAVGAARTAGAQEVKKVVRRGIPAIWVMEPDGSNPRPLVKMRGARWHGSPTWSRDGNWVAFDATPEGFNRGEVYVYA